MDVLGAVVVNEDPSGKTVVDMSELKTMVDVSLIWGRGLGFWVLKFGEGRSRGGCRE